MSNNQATGMVACVGCAADIHSTAVVCPKCGAAQRARGYKSKPMAAVLAFLLGGIGIHRFYLGQWWGFLYLLFCWTGVPVLIALVECFVFLLSDQVKWDEKYNQGKPAAPGEGAGALKIAVTFIVGALAITFLLGIIAAIALPAYNDYVLRSRVDMALMEAASVKLAVAEHVAGSREMPVSNGELGLADPYITPSQHQVSVNEYGIEIVIGNTKSVLDGQSIQLRSHAREYSVDWTCSSNTIEPRLLPPSCRNQR